jgi:beta-carotene hydroxylase
VGTYVKEVQTRPASELLEVGVTQLVLWGWMGWMVWSGRGRQLLLYYVLPTRIASALLAYSFDYVPHRPHKVRRAEDEYRTSSRIDGVFGTSGLDLTIPLLFQNYHIIHHLYPSVPFYRYVPAPA